MTTKRQESCQFKSSVVTCSHESSDEIFWWRPVFVNSWQPDKKWSSTSDDLTKNVRQLVTMSSQVVITKPRIANPSLSNQHTPQMAIMKLFIHLHLAASVFACITPNGLEFLLLNGTRARGSERLTALAIKHSPIMMPTTEPLVPYRVRFILFNHLSCERASRGD